LAKNRFIFRVSSASAGAGTVYRALVFEFTQAGPNRSWGKLRICFAHMTQHAHNRGMCARAPTFCALFEYAVQVRKRQKEASGPLGAVAVVICHTAIRNCR